MNNPKRDKSKVSVTVCALNEEANIADCLAAIKAARPYEIIVLDGGSQDRTVEIAKKYTDQVFQFPNTSLSERRNKGIFAAKGDYVMMVDADHRIPPDAIGKLCDELDEFGFDGIQTQLLSQINDTYWERGMEQNFRISHNFPGQRIVIGTPALYKKDVIQDVGIEAKASGGGDDTDWCYRLCKKGYKIGVGRVVAHQCHRATFKQVLKKWQWYGKGDAQFFLNYPERRFSIFMHPLQNYVVKRSLKTALSGAPQYVPFFVVVGLSRHFGFLSEMKKILVKKIKGESYQDTDFNYRT